IGGIQVDQQVCQVLDELFLTLKCLHVLHGNLHAQVNGRVLSTFERIDGSSQLGGNILTRVVEGLARCDTSFNYWIERHEGDFAGQHAAKQRTGSHQAVDLVSALVDKIGRASCRERVVISVV